MLKKPSEPETVEKARPPLHVLHEQLVVVAYVEIVDDGRHAYEIFSEMSHHGYASHVGEAWKAEGRVQATLNLPRVTIIICGTAEMWMSHRSSITKL